MRRSQISVELIIILAMALVLFISLYGIAVEKSQQFYLRSTQLYAQQMAESVAKDINAVFMAGDGAQKVFDLPVTLANDVAYSVNIYPSYHLVEVNFTYAGDSNRYSSPILTPRVRGDLRGINSRLILKNMNGEVVVTR